MKEFDQARVACLVNCILCLKNMLMFSPAGIKTIDSIMDCISLKEVVNLRIALEVMLEMPGATS
jgi:hypothetical protein